MPSSAKLPATESYENKTGIGARLRPAEFLREDKTAMSSLSRRLTILGLALSGILLGQPGARAEQVVLSDPLTSWPLNFGAQGPIIMMKPDGLHIIQPKNYSNYVLYTGFTFKDMDASLTIKLNGQGPGDAGLVFWANGQGDYYTCTVAPSAGTFGMYHHAISGNNSSWVSIVPYMKDANIKSGPNAVNTLRLIAKGNSIQVSINGTAVGHVFVQAPAAGGSVGLIGEGELGGPSDFTFSNLTVSQ
jgi:hypothetical protein